MMAPTMIVEPRLIIRADADAAMGTGHVMRCLTLAEAWRSHAGPVSFVTRCGSAPLCSRIDQAGYERIDLAEGQGAADDAGVVDDVLAKYPGAAVVLDGYAFDGEYQRRIKARGNALLVIDDFRHAAHYCADLVLNQNLGAEKYAYRCEPYTRLLLGPRYVLLRSEFAVWRAWQRAIPDCGRRVLITLGGSDADNETLKAVRAVGALEGIEARVVVGAANPHLDVLRETVHDLEPRVRVVADVSTMAELMAWADVAVSAGGTTCWELAFMGLPNVILVLADNQLGIARELDAGGVSRFLGWARDLDVEALSLGVARLLDDREAREEMSSRGRALVDGAGAGRVVEALLSVAEGSGV